MNMLKSWQCTLGILRARSVEESGELGCNGHADPSIDLLLQKMIGFKEWRNRIWVLGTFLLAERRAA